MPAEIRVRPCLSLQPFQPRAVTFEPRHLQAESHHRSYRVARSLHRIRDSLTVIAETGSHSSDGTLWGAMPNVGMGGQAITYLIWPLLALSALCLSFLLRAMTKGQTGIFFATLTLMLATTVALHPQDSQLSFTQKLGAVSRYLLAP